MELLPLLGDILPSNRLFCIIYMSYLTSKQAIAKIALESSYITSQQGTLTPLEFHRAGHTGTQPVS